MHKIAILSGLTLPVAKLTKEMIKIIVAEWLNMIEWYKTNEFEMLHMYNYHKTNVTQ